VVVDQVVLILVVAEVLEVFFPVILICPLLKRDQQLQFLMGVLKLLL
jgi:hypothetical protein